MERIAKVHPAMKREELNVKRIAKDIQAKTFVCQCNADEYQIGREGKRGHEERANRKREERLNCNERESSRERDRKQGNSCGRRRGGGKETEQGELHMVYRHIVKRTRSKQLEPRDMAIYYCKQNCTAFTNYLEAITPCQPINEPI